MPSKQTNLWLHGLGSAVITGACSAGMSHIGAIVTGCALDLKQLATVAVGGGIVGMLAYLNKSPLPATEPPNTESK